MAAPLESAPAWQEFLQRAGEGGTVSLEGVHPAAHSWVAGLLRGHFPDHALVLAADGVKAQELLQQDVETWLPLLGAGGGPPLFYPSWEVLPQDSKLPHSDVIAERLQTGREKLME